MATSKKVFALMFALGYVCSLIGTALIQRIDRGEAWASAGLDFLVMMAAAMSYQVWHNERHDFRLLVVEALGSTLATFLVVKWG